jgi:hypothetical protein
MNQASRQKYEVELHRLDAEFADLQHHWQRVPRFALVGLSVPVAFAINGFSGAVVALLVSAALVATRWYLIAVRKSENRWIRASVAREISQ